jgi:hypothetical protein
MPPLVDKHPGMTHFFVAEVTPVIVTSLGLHVATEQAVPVALSSPPTPPPPPFSKNKLHILSLSGLQVMYGLVVPVGRWYVYAPYRVHLVVSFGSACCLHSAVNV